MPRKQQDDAAVPNWEEEAQAYYGNFQQNWRPPPSEYTPVIHYSGPTPQFQATLYNHPAQYAQFTSFSQPTTPTQHNAATHYSGPTPQVQATPYKHPAQHAEFTSLGQPTAPTQYNASTGYLSAQLFSPRDHTPDNMPTPHAQPDPKFRATANIERTPSGQPNPYIQQERPHSQGHEHDQVEHDPSQDASASMQHSQNDVQQGENEEGVGTRQRRRRRRRGAITCPDCDKTFDHKTSQVRHAKVTHNDNPTRPVCRFCGKSFGRNDTLMRHLRDKHDGALS